MVTNHKIRIFKMENRMVGNMPDTNNIHEILLKYWGFSAFRPLQEEIIRSVLKGNDTLALLPTGGGKSVCFQVPGLALPGTTLVISPLIALMKDQVANLIRKGIKAAAVYSGMDKREIDVTLDNCLFGGIRFLYVSPERLQSERFIEALRQMNINLLAVDEAHCISQWGYDFRPPYLEIAGIRELLTGIPVIALTATATPEVVIDIQEKLRFKQKNTFQKSFERKNLTYLVYKEEDKLGRLLRIIRNVSGTGIVYVRNRRKTKEIATFLMKNNIRAGYYHAGLDAGTREIRQNEWMSGKTDVIVATNAFGMGIDKPDVRYVVHMDLTDSLEAYFQEAGRAGRDEKRSYAVMLYEQADIDQVMTNYQSSFPDSPTIKMIYNALGNYFGVPEGSGEDQPFDFELSTFCKRYNLPQLVTFSALKILEREGYLLLNDAIRSPSKIYLKVSKETLYHFQVAHPLADAFIKTLLRSYSGLFSDFIRIDETILATRTGLTKANAVKMLKKLQEYGILTYLPPTEKPQLTFARPRIDGTHLGLSESRYSLLKEMAWKRLEAVITYISATERCRSQQLLAYFGETGAPPCGGCDSCKMRKNVSDDVKERNGIIDAIKTLLGLQPMPLADLVNAIGIMDENKVIEVIRWLMEQEKIKLDSKQRLQWNHH